MKTPLIFAAAAILAVGCDRQKQASNDRPLDSEKSAIRKTAREAKSEVDKEARAQKEVLDAEAKSAGGIFIPDSAQEKPSQGEIIAVGPGGRDEAGKLIPIDLKKGDRVLFGKWSGTEVKLDSVDYLIMKESDIMGVLQETVAKKKAA